MNLKNSYLMIIKYIIMLSMLFFTSCKNNNSFCINDNASHSNTMHFTFLDKRKEKIQDDEYKKDPDACKKKKKFEGNVSLIGYSNEEIYISWEKCQARGDRIEQRYKALPPLKPEDLKGLSGFSTNKDKTLPLCSKCPNCAPISLS